MATVALSTLVGFSTQPVEISIQQYSSVHAGALPIVGATLGANDNFVAWLKSPQGVAVGNATSIRIVPISVVASVVGASFISDSIIQVVDRENARITTATIRGRIVSQHTVRLDGRIVAAALARNRWFIVS